jgi:GH24 family phage-related lysozyme (muramidase)
MNNIVKIQQRLNELGYTIYPMFNNYGPKTTNAVKNFQKDNGLPETGIMNSKTYSLLFPENKNYLIVSKQTIDKLIEFEISSKSYYDKYLQNPHFPGGSSGITIGLGYDLGYHTEDEIRRDWSSYISSVNLSRLIKVARLKGNIAKSNVNSLKDIKITYNDAFKVFIEVSYPKYVNQTISIYPELNKLHSSAIGALVSLVYNRGNSVNGANRVEMKELQTCIKNSNYECMSDTIIKMKRLWVNTNLKGLLSRRDWEASMCLNQQSNQETIKIYY